MSFTVRRDTEARYSDYKSAFLRWIETPDVHSIVFVENSGFDLSELEEIARKSPEKRVEFLSFECPPFDGALGKGYGEMLCLQYGLEHSAILRDTPSFLKVTGRYYLRNARAFLRFIEQNPEVEVSCIFFLHLTWADSRAFGGRTDFLKDYLCPMLEVLNDTAGCTFEHALARAAQRAMADGRPWRLPPEVLEIEGVSGSLGYSWKPTASQSMKRRVRHQLTRWLLREIP